MSLAGKGKESRPWWRDRIEYDPEAMPPPEWSAEPRAESSEESESVDSERLRNPYGVDSDHLMDMAEIYGWWEEGSEESEGRPEPEEPEGQSEPEQSGQPAPKESGGPGPAAIPGESAANPGVPSLYQGPLELDPNSAVPTWCSPEAYAAYSDTRTMYEKYGVHTDDLPTYSEMGIEMDSDNPEFDGVPEGRGR